MKRVLATLALGGALVGMTTGGAAAAMKRETIHLKAPAGMSALRMTKGVAKVTYTPRDVAVRLTVEHLPAAMKVHGSKYFVVWLTNGHKRWFLGDLKRTGAMGGVSGTLMLRKFQSIVVTAEKEKHPMRAMGTVVLSGMSAGR